MTSTVVGTCIVSALVLAGKRKLLTAKSDEGNKRKADVAITAAEPISQTQTWTDENLSANTLLDQQHAASDLTSIRREAVCSLRQCVCEGRERLETDIYICDDCGHRACGKCRGRPEHAYCTEPSTEPRTAPQAFKKQLVDAMPMRVQFKQVSLDQLEKPKECTEYLWTRWMQVLQSG